MPRPILYEPYAVWFRGIIKDPIDMPDFPMRVDDLVMVEKTGPETWQGESDLSWAWLRKGFGEWVLDGFLWDPHYLQFFYAYWPDDIFIAANHLYWGVSCYDGGEAWVLMEPVENVIADSVGAITGPKSFYEPMPLATPHSSFRYARQADGTRVYVRTEI